MSQRSIQNDNSNEASRNVIFGRRNARYCRLSSVVRGNSRTNFPCIQQEVEKKYRKAQAELDDLVVGMDNL